MADPLRRSQLRGLRRHVRRGSKAVVSPVVIFEAVDLILRVHGEGHAVEALVTDDTAEAAWVVGLPQGLEDLRQHK